MAAREDVNIKVSANVAEAIQLWKAMEAGPDGMAKALSAMGEKGGKAAKTAGDEIVAMAQKFTSAAAILATVVATLKKVEDTAQAAADRVAGSVGSFGELQQVSRTPQEFAANVGRARGMVSTGVVGKDQADLAANIVFSMVSAGYTEEEKDYIEQLGRTRFVKPEGLLGLAEGLQKYRRTFGAQDAGTLPEVTDKVIQAAGTAQASIPDTMKGLLESAEGASNLGMSDEQMGAGWLAVESLSANPDLATTKYRSLLNQLYKKKRELWRGNLGDSVADLQRREKAGANIFKILEEGRAVEAYVDITKTQEFMAQQEQLLGQAPSQKLFETQSGFLLQDKQLAAADRQMKSEGALAVTEQEMYAEKESLFASYRAAKKNAILKRSGPFLGGIKNVIEDAFDTALDYTNMEWLEIGRQPRRPAPAAPVPQVQVHRFIGPDGLDIPTEPAARDLGDAPDATRNMIDMAR